MITSRPLSLILTNTGTVVKCPVSGGAAPLALRAGLRLVAGGRKPAGRGCPDRLEGRQDERKAGKILPLGLVVNINAS